MKQNAESDQYWISQNLEADANEAFAVGGFVIDC